MPRPRSPNSDVSDGEDGLAEQNQELQKLQRSYRIMDGDRKAYSQESQDLIKKQKKEMEKLEKEQEELLKDLRLIDSRSNQTKDDRHTEGLGELGRQKQDVQTQLAEEKQKQEELDAETREWEKKIRDQHKNMGGVNNSQLHSSKTKKNIRKLENQLEGANKKFSDALEANKFLREDIDSLRVDRQRFDGLYKKLEKELEQLRQEIGDVIGQSTAAYDARDEAQAKMVLLKEKADKDLQQHNAEMKELCRIIDHDRNLRDFMNTKGKERPEDPQLVEWRQRKEALEAEKKKASQVDTVESYEAAFERIKELAEEEDIDLLVQRFIEVEDRNFALFNYVNEQNNEIETLQEQIQQIQQDIQQFQDQGVELESQRKAILKDLEDKQAGASQQADDNDKKHTAVVKILDQLRAGVDSLFGKINCDQTAIDDMLGPSQGVTDKNVLQHMGVIEERTNQLLRMQAYIQSQKEEDYRAKPPALLGEGPQPAPQPPPIMPPAVGDDIDSAGSEVSDEDSRPFTRNELVSKAMKSVKKRESTMRKEGFRYDLSDAREKTKKKDKSKPKH